MAISDERENSTIICQHKRFESIQESRIQGVNFPGGGITPIAESLGVRNTPTANCKNCQL